MPFSVQYPIMFNGATKLEEKALKDFSDALDFLEIFLGVNKYAAGDHLTIADIVLIASASTFLVRRFLF